MKYIYLVCKWSDGYMCCDDAHRELDIVSAHPTRKIAEKVAEKLYHQAFVEELPIIGNK